MATIEEGDQIEAEFIGSFLWPLWPGSTLAATSTRYDTPSTHTGRLLPNFPV